MFPFRYLRRAFLNLVLISVAFVVLCGCQSTHAQVEPSIEFSRIPAAGDGSPDKLEKIEGRVRGAHSGQKVVLFAQSGVWWVQPFVVKPFTEIQPDSTWTNSTHPGVAYAALLVDSSYHPPLTVETLPDRGGPILAVVTASGGVPPSPPKTLQFSGYRWEVRDVAGDAGGKRNFYDPANAWVDDKGFLHLVITKQAGRWMCAEVKLSRSLGYGSYRFVVQDISHLEPAAVFGLSTWDNSGPREMDVEISRWGEPADKNAQYVIQPYVVPANTVRFSAPGGMLTHWIDWQPGRAEFKTLRGSLSSSGSPPAGDSVDDHVFTSGIPSSGNEAIHMILYVFDNRNAPMQRGTEVIIEKFEFLP